MLDKLYKLYGKLELEFSKLDQFLVTEISKLLLSLNSETPCTVAEI